jgi:hypothetical protein
MYPTIETCKACGNRQEVDPIDFDPICEECGAPLLLDDEDDEF